MNVGANGIVRCGETLNVSASVTLALDQMDVVCQTLKFDLHLPLQGETEMAVSWTWQPK